MHTGNRIMGQMGRTGWYSPFGPLFHFLSSILFTDPVYYVTYVPCMQFGGNDPTSFDNACCPRRSARASASPTTSTGSTTSARSSLPPSLRPRRSTPSRTCSIVSKAAVLGIISERGERVSSFCPPNLNPLSYLGSTEQYSLT